MEEQGIIEPTECPAWINPLRIVLKNPDEAGEKTPELRITLDLRVLNQNLIVDRHPTPNIEMFLSELQGATVFSKLDLSKAFWQVPLAEESRDLTAFMTPYGLRRFTRMVMGLASSPTAFQRIMDHVLADCVDRKQGFGAKSYLDDVILYARCQQDMDVLIDRVLHRLYVEGFRLSREKCVFSVAELTYLGHNLSAKGISPSPANVESLLKAEAPRDKVELESFLGLATYYMRFIRNFSALVSPLHDVANAVRWEWTEVANRSFIDLKSAMAETAQKSLKYFVPGGKTCVTSDASSTTLSAILSQVIDGVEAPISFFSRRLQPRELKFGVGEKEALSLIEAIERWHLYLCGTQFHVKTDHAALTTILSPHATPRVTMRIGRWASRLLMYCFTISYIPSKDNPADCLSRLPTDSRALRDCLETEPPDEIMIATTYVAPREAYDRCVDSNEFDQIKKWITTGWPGAAAIPRYWKQYYVLRDELFVDDHDCLRRGENGVLVVPEAVRQDVLNLAHAGHHGIHKTKSYLRLWAWWPGLSSDVDEFIQSCRQCAVADKTYQHQKPPPDRTIPTPVGPWMQIAIDIVGPISTLPNHQYIITLQDEFSKWPELATTKNCPSSRDVISFLRPLFTRYGVPEQVKTDGGAQFCSAEFRKFLNEQGSIHHVTTPYNSRSNAVVERFNGTVMNTVRMLRAGDEVREKLEELLMTYRAGPHSTTKVSPARLFLGREMRTRLAASCAEYQKIPPSPKSTETWPFRVGELVMVRSVINHIPKGCPKWEGPFRIQEVFGNGVIFG